MYDKIAVAVRNVDDDSRDALALAATLARASGASLLLASIWVSPFGAGGVFERVADEELRSEVEQLATELPDDVPYEIVVRGARSVARGLHDVVEQHGADLLVLGPSHLGLVGRRLLGDVGVASLHDAPCAIAVALHGQRFLEPGLRDVVVAYDATPEAEVALDLGIELCERTGASLRVVRVLDSPYAFSAEPWIGADGMKHWLQSCRDEAGRSLELARKKASGRCSVSTELRDGLTNAELRSAAQAADLVVCGSRGHGAVTRMVVGSTAAALVRNHPCPVVVTPRPVATAAATAA